MVGRVVQWVLRIVAAMALLLIFALMAAVSSAPTPSSVVTKEGALATPRLAPSEEFSATTPRFDVDVVVRDDGSIAVTEDITEDFGAFSKHGIERIIPEVEDVAGGGQRLFEVTDLVVSTSPGTPADAKLTADDVQLTIRIGDPDTTIRDVHAYRLEYVVPAVVTQRSDDLRLLWDAISSWQEQVGRLTFRITGPARIVDTLCEAGELGSTVECTSTEVNGRTVTMVQDDLFPYQAVTADVTWAADAFGPVAAPASPDSLSERVGGMAGVVVVIAGLVVLVIAQIVIMRRAKREQTPTPANLDATFSIRPGGAASGGVGTLPLVTPGDLHAVGDDPVVEFVPPQRLRPVELAALLERGSNSTRLAGTAIDLAARGYFDIAQDPADAKEWTLTWKGSNDPSPLRGYEDDVLQTLFAGATSVRLSDRKTSMPGLATRQRSTVKRDLKAMGMIPKRTRAHSGAHVLAGVLTAVALVGAGIGLAAVASQGVIALALVPIGIVLGIITIFVPVSSFTPLGAAMAWRAAGFKRLFDESENYHAELAANAGVMRDYMGYAVTLGSVDRWTSAFPAEVQQATGSLYSPLMVAAFYTSVSSAATPPRSSSSGFSGGGSFGGGGAGGGGGGGGGGSW
jgi:hypothetical protein